jgi:hypothetical protein
MELAALKPERSTATEVSLTRLIDIQTNKSSIAISLCLTNVIGIKAMFANQCVSLSGFEICIDHLSD